MSRLSKVVQYIIVQREVCIFLCLFLGPTLLCVVMLDLSALHYLIDAADNFQV